MSSVSFAQPHSQPQSPPQPQPLSQSQVQHQPDQANYLDSAISSDQNHANHDQAAHAPSYPEPSDVEAHHPYDSPQQQHHDDSGDAAHKEKRSRNKPSLSCEACSRCKTKCSRERPVCFACQKRRSPCHYSQVADLIEDSHRSRGLEGPRKRQRVSKANQLTDSAQASPQSQFSPAHFDQLGTPRARAAPPMIPLTDDYRPIDRTPSRSSTGSAPSLLSNIPFSHPTASNIFKVEHPFSNYWTHQGGLTEVIQVLPSKEQSDILVAQYFEAVDPVYPMINREEFQVAYDNFWAHQSIDNRHPDGSLIALIFAMLAMGTQFVDLPSPDEKVQTAEFYISASHQALRVINYLARPSMRTVQTMILIIYFLMNDNHAADAWAFAGMLIRHSCALGYHRDPAITAPKATHVEKQQRRKIWQAVYFQDTFFSVLLKLPPTATLSDCHVEDLAPEVDPSLTIDGASDISYIAGMWRLANLVQPTICTPHSLDLPISKSEVQRRSILTEFEAVYATFPAPLSTFNDIAICDLAARSPRLARQALFVTSNYHHCLMLIFADEHDQLALDVYGTLDAAHEAISSFFLLHKLFQDEARVWYHFQHRAFSEALVIAELVKNRADLSSVDPKKIRARDDIIRMVGILAITSEYDIVARTRASVLSKYLE